MTLEELNSFPQFRNLQRIDGNNLDLILDSPPAGQSIGSAMTVSEAGDFLSDSRNTPQYVEYHTADNGDVGYEVIFWCLDK